MKKGGEKILIFSLLLLAGGSQHSKDLESAVEVVVKKEKKINRGELAEVDWNKGLFYTLYVTENDGRESSC